MNKVQEKIAIDFLSFIKENDGFLTVNEIRENPISKKMDFKTDFVVINGLEDLKLIEKIKKSAFRLTQKGWKFKSFRKLHFENRLQLINTKIILLIAIITILINLYQTFFRHQ